MNRISFKKNFLFSNLQSQSIDENRYWWNKLPLNRRNYRKKLIGNLAILGFKFCRAPPFWIKWRHIVIPFAKNSRFSPSSHSLVFLSSDKRREPEIEVVFLLPYNRKESHFDDVIKSKIAAYIQFFVNAKHSSPYFNSCYLSTAFFRPISGNLVQKQMMTDVNYG